MLKAIFFAPDVPLSYQEYLEDSVFFSKLALHGCSDRDYLRTRMDLSLGRKEVLVIDSSEDGILAAVEARCNVWRYEYVEELTADRLREKINECSRGL